MKPSVWKWGCIALLLGWLFVVAVTVWRSL